MSRTDIFSAMGRDLAVLRAEGSYTQTPGGLAWRACGLGMPWIEDTAQVPPNSTVFYLVTGVADGVEGGLGTDSTGVERPNANPCP